MFLRCGLFRITKILKNLFTAFLGAKKNPSLRSGMLKLFFLHSLDFHLSTAILFFFFAFVFYLSNPTLIYISPPHGNPTSAIREVSFTYIYTYRVIPLKGKTKKSLPIQSLISPQRYPIIPFPSPPLFSIRGENIPPKHTKDFFFNLSRRPSEIKSTHTHTHTRLLQPPSSFSLFQRIKLSKCIHRHPITSPSPSSSSSSFFFFSPPPPPLQLELIHHNHHQTQTPSELLTSLSPPPPVMKKMFSSHHPRLFYPPEEEEEKETYHLSPRPL